MDLGEGPHQRGAVGVPEPAPVAFDATASARVRSLLDLGRDADAHAITSAIEKLVTLNHVLTDVGFSHAFRVAEASGRVRTGDREAWQRLFLHDPDLTRRALERSWPSA
jgi:hypothetical protein